MPVEKKVTVIKEKIVEKIIDKIVEVKKSLHLTICKFVELFLYTIFFNLNFRIKNFSLSFTPFLIII